MVTMVRVCVIHKYMHRLWVGNGYTCIIHSHTHKLTSSLFVTFNSVLLFLFVFGSPCVRFKMYNVSLHSRCKSCVRNKKNSDYRERTDEKKFDSKEKKYSFLYGSVCVGSNSLDHAYMNVCICFIAGIAAEHKINICFHLKPQRHIHVKSGFELVKHTSHSWRRRRLQLRQFLKLFKYQLNQTTVHQHLFSKFTACA